MSTDQILAVDALFDGHPTFRCFVGLVRKTIEYFATNLLNLIHAYRREHETTLPDMFNPLESTRKTVTVLTYQQFRDGLRKAQIPHSPAHIDDLMKYLVSVRCPWHIPPRT